MNGRHEHFILGYPEFVGTRAKAPLPILQSLNEDKVDLLHAAWGIAGEVMEYYLAPNQSNKIEELHDIGFYIQMIENGFGNVEEMQKQQHLQAVESVDTYYDKMDLIRKANIFFDLTKKCVIYGNDSIIDKMTEAFVRFQASWENELHMNGITIEEANLLNQSKLIKRYAKGYSDKAAAERADKPAGE